ncbi:MAG: DUF6788 family protein (plasmid) [Leptolyngbya sp. BL-A-14]
MPQRSDFDKLRTVLQQLNLEQARQLYAELGVIVQTLERQATAPATLEAKGREIVETQRLGDRLYQLERVRCGKVGCKCAGAEGELHGPYWYAYWRNDGKLRSRYVGKQLRQVE